MPRTHQGPRAKHWCFTINNYDENDAVMDPSISYMIVGYEVSASGTPHLQGYVCFNRRMRLSAVKRLFPRSHLEVMYSTVAKAIAYCKKDGKWSEWGTKPVTQAEVIKTKWVKAYDHAMLGQFDQIPRDMLTRYYHSYKRIFQDNPLKHGNVEKDNYWIVAPSQYGKSTYARKEWPDYFDKGPNKWWVGYRGEQSIICDDFGPEQCKYLGWYLKRWSDEFPFPIETKGGGRNIRPKHIIITSQYTIAECFEFDDLLREAIENRFKVVNLIRWDERRDLLAMLNEDDEVLEPEQEHSQHSQRQRVVERAHQTLAGFRFRPREHLMIGDDDEVIGDTFTATTPPTPDLDTPEVINLDE